MRKILFCIIAVLLTAYANAQTPPPPFTIGINGAGHRVINNVICFGESANIMSFLPSTTAGNWNYSIYRLTTNPANKTLVNGPSPFSATQPLAYQFSSMDVIRYGTSTSSSPFNELEYIVEVSDPLFPGNPSSTIEQHMTVKTPMGPPDYHLSGGGAFCSNNPVPIIINVMSIRDPNTPTSVPFEYSWLENGNFVSTISSQDMFTIIPTQTTTIQILRISDQYSCPLNIRNNEVITATRIQQPDFNWDASSITTYCENNNNASLLAVPLTPDPNYKFAWTKSPGTTLLDQSPSISAPTLDEGQYTLNISNTDVPSNTKTCTQTLTKTITKIKLPTYTISGGSSNCSGTPNNVIITLNNGIPPYHLSYKDGTGAIHAVTVGTSSSSNPVMFTVPETNIGSYSVLSISDASPGGCQGIVDPSKTVIISPSTTVIVTPNPQVSFCEGTNSSVNLSSLFDYSVPGGNEQFTCTTDASAISGANFIKSNTAGVYTIEVTYAINSCLVRGVNKITVQGKPNVLVSPNATVCTGQNLSLNAQASSGTGPYKYNWSPSTNLSDANISTPTFTANSSVTQTYSVVATDDNNCQSNAASTMVTVYDLPIVTAGANPSTICVGETSQITAIGADSYIWDNPLTPTATNTVSPLTTKTYSVTGTDSHNCVNVANVIVNVNNPPIVNLGPDKTSCAGTQASFDAGAGMTDYHWNNGSTSQTISTGTAGTYSVTVTKNGCEASDDANLTLTPLPTVSLGVDKNIAAGSSVTFDAGSGFDSYAWSNGTTSQTISTGVAGTYIVTVTRNGCSASDTVTLTLTALPVVNLGSDTTICDGSSITLDAGNSADTYLWSNGQNTRSISVSSAGTYTVTATKSGFQATDAITINVTQLPIISLGADKSFCQQGTIDAGVGYDSYKWNTGSTSQIIYVNNSSLYTVEVTKQGCSAKSSINIDIQTNQPFSIGGDTAICSGESLTLKAINGADSYLWSTSSTNQTLAVNSAGTYMVTATTGVCNATASRTISIKPQPLVTVNGNRNLCSGESLILNASGADSYVWSNGTTGQTVNLQPTASTSITVTGTKDNCSSKEVVPIIVGDTLVVQVSADTTICYGEQATLIASGNATQYSWDQGLGNGAIKVVNPTDTTTYTVTGYLNACYVIKSVTVNVIPPVTLTPRSDTTICAGSIVGSSITLSVSGNATSYSWDNNLGTGSTHQVSPLVSTRYRVTGNIGHCVGSNTVNITVNPSPTVVANMSKNAICKGETISLYGSGALVYTWSDSVSDGVSFTPSTSKTYYVTGSDANGCSANSQISVTVNDLPNISIVGNLAICSGDRLSITAGGASSYIWNNGSTSNTLIETPASNTMYSVTGTLNGCSSSKTVQALITPNPVVNLGPDLTKCSNETAILNATTNNASYTWNDGSTQPTKIVTAPAGTFWVDVIIDGCKSRDSVLVSYTTLPNFQIIGPSTVYKGDTAYYEVSRSFASYVWNTGELKRFIKPIVNNDQKFEVAVADNYNCRDSAFISVKVLPIPVIDINDTTICSGDYATLTVKDDFDTYEWSNGSTDKSTTVTTAGIYTVTATKLNTPSISIIDTITVSVIAKPNFNHGDDDEICEGETSVLWVEQQPALNYKWNTGSTSNEIVAEATGYYNVTVTAFGCPTVVFFHVDVKSIPPKPAIQGRTKICYNEQLPTLVADGQDVVWYDESSFQIATGNSYTPTALSTVPTNILVNQTVNGCQSPFEKIELRRIPKNDSLQIIAYDSTFCEGDADGTTFSLSASNVLPAWSVSGNNVMYHLSDSTETMQVDWLSTGVDTIFVTTTDQWGCQNTDFQRIYIAPKPSARFYTEINNGEVTFHNISDSSIVPDINTTLGNSYSWNFNINDRKQNYIPCNKLDTSVWYEYGEHMISLIATNEYGCTDTVNGNVFIDHKCALFVPNAFYPEGQSPTIKGFRPAGTGLEDYQIWIYDGWSNLIWYSNKLIDGQPLESWYGSYNNQIIKTDNYYWKIKATFVNGQKLDYSGNIVLVR